MGSFLLKTILFLSQPKIGGLNPGLQWFVPQPHGWNAPATPRLDKGAKGQGGHLLHPFLTFVELCRPELGEGLDNEPPLP